MGSKGRSECVKFSISEVFTDERQHFAKQWVIKFVMPKGLKSTRVKFFLVKASTYFVKQGLKFVMP